MPGPNAIDSTLILAKALDGLSLRQHVTADNIANADTPGFKASSVRFEEALQRFMAPETPAVVLVRTNADHLSSGGTTASGLEAETVQMNGTTLRLDGNNVDIEQQMAVLAETTLKFNAVSEAISRRLAIQRLIATNGRG